MEAKKNIPFRPFDFFILVSVIFFAVFSFLKIHKTKADEVLVTANGKEFSYSLEKDGIYTVKGVLGITTFEIQDGKIRIIDSPCPNKTCIAMGFSDIIVCLPNNVMIQKISHSQKNNGEIDAVSQ